MRAIAGTLLVLALAGCARADQELARVRAQISFADLPPLPASEEPAVPDPPAPCVDPYEAALEDSRFTRLGGVRFADLGSRRRPWLYAPAREYARHMNPTDDLREQLLDNGADAYVAQYVHVVVPGGRTATIDVSEPLNVNKLALIPGGVSRFGGYTVLDGEPAVACEAGPLETTFPLGLVVEGARCAVVTVRLDGAPPESRLIPFGRRRCP